jgi:purine-binding chemotaxis protein CheW
MSPRSGDEAQRLRDSFDQSFAAPPQERESDGVDVLTLRVQGDAHAVRVDALRSIVAARRLTPFPSQAPHVLGLVGVRGVLVPVYSLAGLLGYAGPAEPPRWLLLAGRVDLVALAVAELSGHLRVPARDVIDSGGMAAGLIDLDRIVGLIEGEGGKGS